MFYSVLAGKHQREDAHGPLWIGRIFRAVPHILVVVVYLPEELSTHEIEGSEVVLAMRIVLLCKPGEIRDLTERLGLTQSGSSATPIVIITLPPQKVCRKASLRRAILFIIALLRVLAPVRRHVASAAVRTVIVTLCGPHVAPLAV